MRRHRGGTRSSSGVDAISGAATVQAMVVVFTCGGAARRFVFGARAEMRRVADTRMS